MELQDSKYIPFYVLEMYIIIDTCVYLGASSVCVCVCVCVSVCVCMCTRTRACMYIYIYIYEIFERM